MAAASRTCTSLAAHSLLSPLFRLSTLLPKTNTRHARTETLQATCLQIRRYRSLLKTNNEEEKQKQYVVQYLLYVAYGTGNGSDKAGDHDHPGVAVVVLFEHLHVCVAFFLTFTEPYFFGTRDASAGIETTVSVRSCSSKLWVRLCHGHLAWTPHNVGTETRDSRPRATENTGWSNATPTTSCAAKTAHRFLRPVAQRRKRFTRAVR